MEISQLIPHVEALIFAADRPLPAADILELLNSALAFLEDRASMEQVETAIEAISEKYNSEFYAFEVRESGGGYQFLTKRDYYQTVAQLNGEKYLKRLSTAALETLAIIAYKQPISKGEIEHIRGVSTDYSITKLLEKELIVISGRSEDLPGKPLLYRTSKAFMDYFGINSPADLPKLKEVFDEEYIQPTLMDQTEDSPTAIPASTEEELEAEGHFIVSEDGELTKTVTLMIDDEVAEEGESEGDEGPQGIVVPTEVAEGDVVEDEDYEDDAIVDVSAEEPTEEMPGADADEDSVIEGEDEEDEEILDELNTGIEVDLSTTETLEDGSIIEHIHIQEIMPDPLEMEDTGDEELFTEESSKEKSEDEEDEDDEEEEDEDEDDEDEDEDEEEDEDEDEDEEDDEEDEDSENDDDKKK
ncbi:SMC-Scp complex subunit ScpB [uncultured Chitinophaga sp.]|uniref:SMC-Scp complex subunit ScpB n=1 Tax=uncultured Chitinophaga sp. TaxID=339340 RepID=UPI0025CD1FDE|nr:SMC-Scp complex subunit ScpB [uncultured Chitinophaga sp.]